MFVNSFQTPRILPQALWSAYNPLRWVGFPPIRGFAMSRSGARYALLAVLLSVFPPFLSGQSNSGQVTGAVFDQTKAVVNGVVISAVNIATNVAQTAISNKDGVYTIPASFRNLSGHPGKDRLQTVGPGTHYGRKWHHRATRFRHGRRRHGVSGDDHRRRAGHSDRHFHDPYGSLEADSRTADRQPERLTDPDDRAWRRGQHWRGTGFHRDRFHHAWRGIVGIGGAMGTVQFQADGVSNTGLHSAALLSPSAPIRYRRCQWCRTPTAPSIAAAGERW